MKNGSNIVPACIQDTPLKRYGALHKARRYHSNESTLPDYLLGRYGQSEAVE